MKNLVLLLLLSSLAILAKENYSPILQEAIDQIENEDGVDLREHPKYKPFKRWLHVWKSRIRNDELPDRIEMYNIVQNERKKSRTNNLLSSDKKWKSVGPNTPPSGYGIGRINRLRFHPDDENTIFAATAGGGVWKTTNGGDNWNILPTSDFLSMNYSDVVISESNPNIIYLATGDANAAYLNGDFYSVGVLKSTDGGNSFQLTNLVYDLSEKVLVASLLVDPDNADHIIAGTSNGIYISEDGGDTWVQKNNLPIKDLEILPNNKNILLATTFERQGPAQILRSEDFGQTWETVRSISNAVRIELATDPNFPDYVTAVAVEVRPYNFLAFLKSEDGGQTFDEMADKTNTENITGRNGRYPSGNERDVDQAWYNLSLSINPRDKNEVYVGGIDNWASISGGTSWLDLELNVHVDQHYHLLSRDGSKLYLANDGGFYEVNTQTLQYEIKSRDMVITQFYKCDASSGLEYFIGGTQDNSTFAKRNEDGFWWRNLGGDGMDCHIDPQNENIWYGSSQYGNFRRTTNAGQSWDFSIDDDLIAAFFGIEQRGDWVTPFAVDHQNPNTVYAGYYDIFVNNNYGQPQSWERLSNFGTSTSLIFLEVSEKNSDYIMAGFSNVIFLTTNGGNTWNNLPTPTGTLNNVTFHPENENIIYAVASNYRKDSKVFKYEGGEWENYTGNLPNVPVNVIKVQENSPERLYIGTDIGVYYTDNGTKNWERYGSDMPYTFVNDLEIDVTNDHLLAATYGRGMWENSLIYCENDPIEIVANSELEFCEGESVVLEVSNPQAGVQYEWSNGEVGNSIEVNQDGLYSAKELGTGCVSRSNLLFADMLEVDPLELTATSNTFCTGDSVFVRAPFGSDDYLWNDGVEGFGRHISEPGVYSVTAVLDNGCLTSGEIEIFEADPVAPEIDIIDDRTLSSSLASNKYQWYFENEPIQGATSRNLSATFTGEYFVEIQSEFGCDVASEAIIFEPVSVEYSSSNFEILPNPSDGVFILKSTKFSGNNFDISITDINGKIIFSKNNFIIKSNGSQINLKDAPKGVYFIKLQSQLKTYTEKIIIE